MPFRKHEMVPGGCRVSDLCSRYRHFLSWQLQQNKGYPRWGLCVNRHQLVYGSERPA